MEAHFTEITRDKIISVTMKMAKVTLHLLAKTEFVGTALRITNERFDERNYINMTKISLIITLLLTLILKRE